MAQIEVDGFLADSVVSAEGKLFVQGGGWNRLTASLFPAVHDRIAVGLLIRIGAGEARAPHRFEMRVVDPQEGELKLGDSEGGPIHRLSGEFSAGSEEEEQLIPIAINLNGVTLPRPGSYQVVVSVDGTDVKTIPFRVQSLASQGPSVTGSAGYL